MSAEIPFEAFADLSLVTELALSPDGERVAFVADEFDPDADERRRSLFVVPTDGSRDPHRLTRASDAGQPRWSPDGTRLGFVAAREADVARAVGRTEESTDEDGEEDEEEETADGGGDEEPKPQLWVFDLERGGDARQVTDRDEGVAAFDWGPDGDRVVIASRDPTDEQQEYLEESREGGPVEIERLQHKADGTGWLDDVTTYLFVVDLESGEADRLDDAYGGGAMEPFVGLRPSWSDGGIAFLSNRTERPDDSTVMDCYTIQPDGSDLQRVTDGELSVDAVEWDPTGTRLAFVGGDPENWCIPDEVYVTDEDRTAYRSLTPDLDRGPDLLRTLRWRDEETVIVNVGDEATTRLLRANVDGDEPEWATDGLGADRSMEIFDVAGETVALALSHPTDGLDVHAAPTAALAADEPGAVRDSLRRLTGLNDDLLAEHPTPTCRRVTYESDGVDIDAILYLPEGAEESTDEPLPLIVSIHGGPITYDAPEFRFEYAAWASRGYAVLCPNYRGSTSYGRDFAEELWGDWGTAEVADVAAGVAAVVGRDIADPERVFGRGISYGGIAQAHVAAQTDVLTAGAPEQGIYDRRADFGTSDSQVWASQELGLPWENPEGYDANSSITDVGEIDCPMLVVAGGQDWRCPPSQSEQLYVSLRKRDVPAKLVVYPDEHHNLDAPERAIHRLETLAAWYREHDPAVEAQS